MHNEDMENASQPATKADLTLARRKMAFTFDQTISTITGKMDAYHAETSRALATLMQAVMTMQGMFQRVDNDQTFTRRRLDSLERKSKPS